MFRFVVSRRKWSLQSHGGTISVQSEVGEGATFVIRLPALNSEPLPAEPPLPEGTPMPGSIQPPEVVRVEPKQSRKDRKKKQRA